MKNSIKKISFVGGLAKILIGLFIIFIITIALFPIAWVFITSLKSNHDIMSQSFGFPTGIHFKNYVKAFSMAPLLLFFSNSIFIATAGTFINLIVMSMGAYVISRFSFKGKTIVQIMFSFALFIPGAALLQPLFVTLTTLKLYDQKMGLVLVYAGLGMATTFYIMLSYYKTIPKALEEAAYIDGAGFYYTFATIVVPLCKPAFATSGILQFLLCWNEFQFALTLTTGNKSRTLPIALYYFTSQFASDYGAMFAATTLVALPSIIFYIALQEQIIAGMTSGAVKG